MGVEGLTDTSPNLVGSEPIMCLAFRREKVWGCGTDKCLMGRGWRSGYNVLDIQSLRDDVASRTPSLVLQCHAGGFSILVGQGTPLGRREGC